MKRKWLLLAISTAIAAVSCSGPDIEDTGSDSSSPLTLSVRTGLPESKSIITGTSLGSGEEIGVFLTDETGEGYDGMSYSNIRFSSSGTSSSQSWNADSEIMLSASKASLYAYYPYSDNVDDIGSIPVECSSEVQLDYMYTNPVTELNNRNSEASLTMMHALSAVRVILKRGTYTGTGRITGISISGENMATGGILNGKNGDLGSLTGKGEPISPDISSSTLDKEGRSIDILAIPTGKDSSIDIEVYIDGETFSVTTSTIALSPGMMSVCEISINNSSVTIAPLKVKAWTTSQKTSASMQKNWTVRLEGDTDEIDVSSSVDQEGRVTIIAAPEYPDAEVNPITVTGNATVNESLNGGTRTITLSNISSDVSVSFDSYSLWITAVYNITSTSSASRLCGQSVGCTRLEIDGQEVPASYQHLFTAIGEHTVRLMFPNKHVIPSNAFSSTNVKSITIPEGVRTLEPMCMQSCNYLTSVVAPQTVTDIGYNCMSSCQSLESFTFPDNLSVMGYGIFSKCYKLKEATLPKNITTLPSSTFQQCYDLTHIEIPESVTKIDNNAFASSGLVSITFPSGLESIGDEAFELCSDLCDISYTDGTECSSELIFKEGLESIGKYAFTQCSKLTAVHIPASVNKIGTAALTAEGIQSMTIAEGNNIYKTVNGFTGIIERNTGTLVSGACNSTVLPPEVLRIGDGAYCYLPISSIDLHENITYVGNQAFYSMMNKKLKTIISRSTTPPQTGKSSVFEGCQTKGTLKVPESAVDAYKESTWMSTSYGFLGNLNWSVAALSEGE